ncbi:MAG: hypothetical protein ABJG88_12270 [Litorimonas sp.]
MSDEKDFFVGYGALPNKDKRFILKAVPAGLLAIAGTGAFIGSRAVSQGGGRWETGTPVTMQGRIGFHPYPVLWVDGIGHVIAGIGKQSADAYCKVFEGQSVEVTGVKIVRNNCFMLGIANGDIKAIKTATSPIPSYGPTKDVSIVGEVLDAQCFMGIMNPGYGRTHRGCATQCIRGGQPVFFSIGFREDDALPSAQTCGGNGYLLANAEGEKINAEILNDIAVPVTIHAKLEKIGNLYRLVYKTGSMRRLS